GIRKTVLTLVPPPKKTDIAFRSDGTLELRNDTTDASSKVIVFDPVKGTATDAAHVRITLPVIAKPPTFAPWMSDRLRAVSWIGDEKNQALKVVVFKINEWIKGHKAAITGDTGEEAAQEDLGIDETTQLV